LKNVVGRLPLVADKIGRDIDNELAND